MQKVDRLGWAAGFSVRAYGVRVGIRTNNPVCMESVCELLPYRSKIISSAIVDKVYSLVIGRSGSRPGIRHFNILYGNHVQLTRSFDLDEVLETLESDLRLFVAEATRYRVFVHAGVVGWKGRAILIPGRSFSGKSTLVAELVKAGATYYSDEYAVIDSRGRVHPFLKPLGIRYGNDIRQERISVSDLGGQSGKKSIPVGLVLVTSFSKDASWRPRQLSPGKGVLELLLNTVSARRSPDHALSMLRLVAANARILKGTRGTATDVVPRILELM